MGNTVMFGAKVRDRPHDECMAEIFRKDIGYAEKLVKSILEDGSPAELLIVLRQLALAFPYDHELSPAKATVSY
ncbi:transcriptional regulator [Zymomonas mobilis]|uniref:transcriptional regulator n=2 Tax=Zymomonas mobilis TaxID=542 RepID=UPI0011D0D725|nr:transcriptional regulator [Zymomonas mobilis]